jgi:hypothetical protein
MALALHLIVSIVSLVCFIMVVVKMFQRGATGMGIASLLLLLCFGLGGLLAFIYGWVKSGEWQIKNIMLVWTLAIIVGIVLNVAMPVQIPGLQLPAQ